LPLTSLVSAVIVVCVTVCAVAASPVASAKPIPKYANRRMPIFIVTRYQPQTKILFCRL
jgi:hypothetical protein